MWGVSYWVFPVVSGLCWLGMLLGLLIHWLVKGSPHYASMDPTQRIAYISDIGAQNLKPLFIAGAVITTIFLDLSFLSEYFLRHQGRLARTTSIAQKVLSWLSMLAALVGTIGLICLSIFDTLRHPTMHDVFLALFIGGYIVSAVFICAEYQRLGIHFRQHRVLRLSFWIKLFFILIEFALAVAFGTSQRLKHYNTSAVLEWVIALVFTFYVFSFFIDLLPAVRTKDRNARFGKDGERVGHFGTGPNETALQMEQNDGFNGKRDSETTMVPPHGTDERVVNGVAYDRNQALPAHTNF